ncbi:hypothetical protein FOL47_010526 [Perkinsus chesapeaki]|uniref:GATA-type domain-containing protein n=1 Tax=Perkinsus chesapeaki TaxID=330153 RepID=A0A7J6MPE7_PERCH|nr:hypothetical protein FOL47_010526 [Perkinsus chesapeaki]
MRCPVTKSSTQAPRSWTPRVSRTPTTTRSRKTTTTSSSTAAASAAQSSKLTISQLKSMVEAHEHSVPTMPALERVQLIPTQIVERRQPSMMVVSGDPGAGSSLPNSMFSAAANLSSCDNCKRAGVALWEDELTGEAFCDECWSTWEAQAAAEDDAQQRQDTPVEDWFMMNTTDEDGDCDMMDDSDDDDIDPAVLYGSGSTPRQQQQQTAGPPQQRRPAPNFAQRSLVALELGKNPNDLYEMCLDKQLLDAYNNAAVNHRIMPSMEDTVDDAESSTSTTASASSVPNAAKGVKFSTGGAVRFFDTDAELQDPCRSQFPIEVKKFDGQSCHHANYIGTSRAAAAQQQQAQELHTSTLTDYSSEELKRVADQMSKPRGVWPKQQF